MKKVTIISTCRYTLSMEEFVRPLKDIVRNCGCGVEVKNYKDVFVPGGEKVIISGTALMDFDYLNYLKNFKWIRNFEGGILGICAGAQLIALTFGCSLVEKKIIGSCEIEFLGEKRRAYFLVSKVPRLNECFEVLGRLNDAPAYFKLKGKEIYGVLFYPEVLNRDLIIKFLKS